VGNDKEFFEGLWDEGQCDKGEMLFSEMAKCLYGVGKMRKIRASHLKADES
jgi:hypothetical protein